MFVLLKILNNNRTIITKVGDIRTLEGCEKHYCCLNGLKVELACMSVLPLTREGKNIFKKTTMFLVVLETFCKRNAGRK